jgi:hypothetical protein
VQQRTVTLYKDIAPNNKPIQTKNDPENKREFFSFGHTNFSEELGLVKEGQRQRGRKCCSREEKPNGLSQHHRIEEIFSRAKQLMFMGSPSQTHTERERETPWRELRKWRHGERPCKEPTFLIENKREFRWAARTKELLA